jgi:hypothetical protein
LATATAIFAFFALGSGVDGQVGYRPPSYPTGNPLPPSSDGPFRNTANSSSTATSRPTIPANDELRRLQAEMDALSRIQDGLIDDPVPSGSDNNAERAKLKERLIELIEKLKSTSRSGGNTSNSRPSVFEQNPDAPPIDRLKQAEALYRAGEIRTAQKVLQSIDPASLGGKPAALARYLRACCHRRLGEYDQARQLYRDIAASKDDAFLAECAAWQLQAIHSREEMAAQIAPTRTPSTPK